MTMSRAKVKAEALEILIAPGLHAELAGKFAENRNAGVKSKRS
jgi:hypothetical protein